MYAARTYCVFLIVYAVDAVITQICRNVLAHHKSMIAKQADDRRASDGRRTTPHGRWTPVQPEDHLARCPWSRLNNGGVCREAPTGWIPTRGRSVR